MEKKRAHHQITSKCNSKYIEPSLQINTIIKKGIHRKSYSYTKSLKFSSIKTGLDRVQTQREAHAPSDKVKQKHPKYKSCMLQGVEKTLFRQNGPPMTALLEEKLPLSPSRTTDDLKTIQDHGRQRGEGE